MSAAAGERAFESGDLVLIRPLVFDGVDVTNPCLGLVDPFEAQGELVAVRPLSDLREIRWMRLSRLELVQRAN